MTTKKQPGTTKKQPGTTQEQPGTTKEQAATAGERPAPAADVCLNRTFFARGAASVARDLLGCILIVRRPDHTVLRARVVETEAYVGEHDLACHASHGRTRRTEVMFGPAGHAYVYLVYGMHFLLNVVTGQVGDAQAVLLRAAEPLPPLEGALNGPGRLTKALSIGAEHNAADVTVPPLCFLRGDPPASVVVTARVGVEYAGAWAAAPLRFYDADSAHVSQR